MLRVGGEVAHSRKTQSGDDRISNDVNVFVNFSGLEASLEMDIAVAGSQLAIHRMRELPIGPANYSSWSIARFPHREHVTGIFRHGHRIFGTTDLAGD